MTTRSSRGSTELSIESQTLLDKMGLPSRLAKYISRDIFGWSWEPAPHITYMEEKIMQAVLDTTKRSFLSISMPPRHGKSMYCSVALPAWFLGMYPEKNVILISYSEDFAIKWGRTVRDVLQRHGKDLFNRTVSRTANSVTDWQMERSLGGMLSVGIGGGITGRGGDLIIVDDLIKNQQEARSAATKKQHKEEYDSSIRTRVEPGGSIIAVATRWAIDDLPGRWREGDEGGDQWDFIDFPALAVAPKEKDPTTWRDALGRKEGDALWPERLNRKDALQLEATLEEIVWMALYQQDPSTLASAMFPEDLWATYPWFEHENVSRKCVRFCRAWDLASSEESGDWTVGVKMGMGGDNRVYVLDVQRFRSGPTEVEARVMNTAAVDGPGCKIVIEQERSGSGKTVVEHYKRTLMDRNVEGIRAEGSKEERASIYAAKMGAGFVLIPDQAPWRDEWIREHKLFGRIRHDDQVDAGSYAFNDLAGQGGVSRIWSPSDMPMNFNAENELRALLERGVLIRR